MENTLKNIHTELVRIRKLITFNELMRIDKNPELNDAQKRAQIKNILVNVLDLAEQSKWNDILYE